MTQIVYMIHKFLLVCLAIFILSCLTYSRPIAGIRAKLEHETTYFQIFKIACEVHINVHRF